MHLMKDADGVVKTASAPAQERRGNGQGAAELEKLRARLRVAQTRIREMAARADTDPLLGILNCRAFMRELSRAIAELPRHETGASLFYITPDSLAETISRHGETAGEALLSQMTWLLRSNVRRSDVLGRVEDNAFGLLLLRTKPEGIDAVTERLNHRLSQVQAEWNGAPLSLGFSCAVQHLEEGTEGDGVMEGLRQTLADHRGAAEHTASRKKTGRIFRR